MAERVASVTAQFKADFSEANAELARWKAQVESSKINVPVSSAFRGGPAASSATSTLGGLTVASSAGLPASMMVPSINVPSTADSLVQRVAMQQLSASPAAADGFQEGLSSPNWSYLFSSRAGGVGVPQSPGSGAGAGFRGMRAFFVGGMLAHAGLGVAEAAREHHIDSVLAGNNFAAQYESTMTYRKRLTGSIPFIGAAFDLATDPFGYEEAAGRLAIKGSKDNDEITSMMASSAEARGRLSGEYASTAAPAGYLRNKAEIENRFGPLARLEQKGIRDREVAPLNQAHETKRSEISNRFNQAIGMVSSVTGSDGKEIQSVEMLQRAMNLALRAEDDQYNALVAQVDARYDNINKMRDIARKAADAANERSRTADVGSLRRRIGGGFTGARGALVDRMMHEQDESDPGDPELNKLLKDANAADLRRFDLVAGNRFRTTTAANMARARGDTFAAAVQMAGGAAFTEYANADASQRFQALGSGFSGIFATFMEGVSSSSLAASTLASGADANALLLARNPMAAQLKRMQAERDKMLFPIRSSTMPGAELVRSGINRFFSSEEDRVRQQYGDEDASINLRLGGERDRLQSLLRHDRVGADVTGIVTSTLGEAMTFGNAGKISQQRAALENGLLGLQLTKQNFEESFHAVEIGQNFDTGSPRGQASMEQMMNDVVRGIDKLTQAIKDVSMGK